jgi:hypothetical protein
MGSRNALSKNSQNEFAGVSPFSLHGYRNHERDPATVLLRLLGYSLCSGSYVPYTALILMGLLGESNKQQQTLLRLRTKLEARRILSQNHFLSAQPARLPVSWPKCKNVIIIRVLRQRRREYKNNSKESTIETKAVQTLD